MGVILQLNNFTIFPYKHDVQFYGKLSTSYLSFIWVFDLYIYLKIFYILSGSLSSASTWFCLYFLSGSVFFLLFHYTYSLFLPEHLCQGLTTRDRKGGLCLAHLLAAWFVWNHLLFTNWLSEIEFSSSNFFHQYFVISIFSSPHLICSILLIFVTIIFCPSS